MTQKKLLTCVGESAQKPYALSPTSAQLFIARAISERPVVNKQ